MFTFYHFLLIKTKPFLPLLNYSINNPLNMNAHERYFAQKLFRNKVLESKGMEFQRFFAEVMSSANANFQNPKPHGNKGDWKCDGYDIKTGQFYQVYSPENPTEQKQIIRAVTKLEAAFEGLLKEWGAFTEVKEFFFVYNDHFWGGVYPEMVKRLSDLSNKHAVPCSLFLSKDLYMVFEGLNADAKANCLQCPIPESTNSNAVVSFEALNEVVKHIMALPYQIPRPGKMVLNPEFLRKIEFNTLSLPVADLLKRGAYQVGALNQYFEWEPDVKVILQQRFSALYEESKQKIADNHPEHSDELFFYIFEKACPEEPKKYFGTAVEALMSYYFECCDIFEPPKTTLFD